MDFIKGQDLAIGKTYQVEFDDCCAKGEFTAVLEYVDPEFDWPLETRWSNGLTLHAELKVEEVVPA